MSPDTGSVTTVPQIDLLAGYRYLSFRERLAIQQFQSFLGPPQMHGDPNRRGLSPGLHDQNRLGRANVPPWGPLGQSVGPVAGS